MGPVVREHVMDMADREATMVHVERRACSKWKKKSGKSTRVVRTRLITMIENLTSFPFWHIPVDVRLGGGGCREDFRP